MAKRRRPMPDTNPGLDASDRPKRPAPDPRWLLSPHVRRIVAHRYFSLTGEDPGCRLPGCGTGRAGRARRADGGGRLDVWADLIAEARAAGFAPFRVTRRTPTGEAFERWRADFLRRHAY